MSASQRVSAWLQKFVWREDTGLNMFGPQFHHWQIDPDAEILGWWEDDGSIVYVAAEGIESTEKWQQFKNEIEAETGSTKFIREATETKQSFRNPYSAKYRWMSFRSPDGIRVEVWPVNPSNFEEDTHMMYYDYDKTIGYGYVWADGYNDSYNGSVKAKIDAALAELKQYENIVGLASWWEDPDKADFQHGLCDTYAKALIDLYPHLRLGVVDGGKHFFAHDDEYAYDSIGTHKLPYLDGALDQDPNYWGFEFYPYGENGTEEDYERAKLLIKQHHPSEKFSSQQCRYCAEPATTLLIPSQIPVCPKHINNPNWHPENYWDYERQVTDEIDRQNNTTESPPTGYPYYWSRKAKIIPEVINGQALVDPNLVRDSYSGCFGWVNGVLFLGDTHHAIIIADIIEQQFMGWDELVSAPQAWGWWEREYNYELKEYLPDAPVLLSFTSDDGIQAPGTINKTKAAFRAVFNSPVKHDPGVVGKPPGQFGERAKEQYLGFTLALLR